MDFFPAKRKTSRRRLLVYTENYFFGGGNRYLSDMVNALVGQYDETLVVSNPGALFPNDKKRISSLVQYSSIQIIAFARAYHGLGYQPPWVKFFLRILFIVLSPLVFFYDFLAFMQLLCRYRPSTVLSCSGGYPSSRTTLIIIIAAWCCRMQTVLSIVSMPTSRRTLFYFFDVLMDALTWHVTDKVIVNARAIATALTAMHDMPAEKAVVIHNGLEENITSKAATGDRSSSIPVFIKNIVRKEQLIIACVARMDQAKGILFLLNAFAQLAKRHSFISLLLVGQGDVSNQLKSEIQEQNLEDSVYLTGHHDGSIDDLLPLVDIYAFPSLHEGFPYSILEAMKAGCAIVASRVGGIPEAIDDGHQGLLVSAGSVDELRDAIEKLILDDALRIRLGHSAKSRFLSDFTLNAMHLKLQGIFDQ